MQQQQKQLRILTPSQVNQFQQDGYLIIKNAISSKKIQELQSEASDILNLIIESSIYHNRQSTRLDWSTNTSGVQVIRKIQPINDLSLKFASVIKDPQLLNPIKDILNEEKLNCFEEKLNYKQPYENKKIPLKSRVIDDYFPIHNDWIYYKMNGYPQDVISSALLLDDCTPDNGPLHFYPGSHKRHLEHDMDGIRGFKVKDTSKLKKNGIDIITKAGTLILFHVLLVHSSRPNLTKLPRRLMIYSHCRRSADMPHDIRNGPTRLRESPYEIEYLKQQANKDIIIRRALTDGNNNIDGGKYLIKVWVDIKSPHSYLIVKPALQLAKDYDCIVKFMPYELSYVKMNLTTDYDEKNPVRKPPNKAEDRRARMFYTVARVYAKAMNVGMRGPKILLNSKLANIGLAYCVKHDEKYANKYLVHIYENGWEDGWRTFDMTDINQLKETMRIADMPNDIIEQFDHYVNSNEGAQDLLESMKEADEIGHVGCPHVSFPLNGKRIGMFGREHLSLIRHTMHQLGLARHEDVNWEMSHYWFENKNASKL